jgi:uncharacterized membrane protein YhhN
MNSVRTLSALVVLACIGLVALLLLDLPLPAAGAKLIASSAFVGVAIVSGAWQSLFGRLLLAGLVLSWFGDMFLVGSTETLFLLGLGAFLLAHVAYIVAFAVHGVDHRWLLLAALPVTGIAIAATLWLNPYVAPYLAIPVRAYTVVISVMVIMAFGSRGAGGSLFIFGGALLFFFSDLSVAALRLVQTDFPTYVWGLPFYYGGQLCLALSISQSRSH